GALAERWNLPPQLVAALRYHRTPTNAPASYAELVRCVAIGALAADVFAAGTLGEGLAAYRTACERWFRLPTEDADGLLVRIGNEAGPLRALLDLPETGVRAGEILARANEALEMLSFMAEDEHNKLEEERERLTAQASTDALTGLGNRRHFDAFFGRAFHQAVRDDAPLSLLMLDLDRFKGINDRYGHPAGDLVLRAAAGAIRESVRATDLAARYGGEEFAIVMPGTGAAGAFGLARRLRASIERLELDLGEEHGVHVTASLGVASLDRARHQRPDDLIADADGALYEAKESGRNMVRLSRGRECAAA
ncbi:MAG: diguanylate cyclase, partial [Dehalococcoidia bacterium]